ncbi:response regulator transcription factor [Propionicimonas sp.]|uniref:response regulator transcription factor n=1 Tax=Propionicimonas sp. TaxID=1955623 RepID=UPI001852FF44|nr:response regulator transcription factor [Propionicimonas sp.]MBU3975730.1 response regulator transcription factor [Actinomycetota bacterium]MBA3019867.1 response regulator transcription factor [Propionicimonas sp.]MBU3986121.1 response regulator transcription factor [Actinomycetota bacterium]MBU4007446.1 response regulator transcription factor [Actinomycetota bacterium]MBU4063948.1 response regulator transcription factor [Actinomycetota bacterium]
MLLALADDAALLRAGLVGLLERAGHQVVVEASDAPSLVAAVAELAAANQLPDLVLTDVRMPPGMTDDGLRAAVEIRQRYPSLPIMVLSQYVAPAYASALLDAAALPDAPGTGYLLKERVGRVADFMNSLQVVAAGGLVIDPEVVRSLLLSRRGDSKLSRLTPREHEVLSLMADGSSNTQISDALVITPAAVAKHVANVFAKLDLGPDEENRRVRAVLAYLNGA